MGVHQDRALRWLAMNDPRSPARTTRGVDHAREVESRKFAYHRRLCARIRRQGWRMTGWRSCRAGPRTAPLIPTIIRSWPRHHHTSLIAIDLVGEGLDSEDAAPMATDVVAIVEHLGIERRPLDHQAIESLFEQALARIQFDHPAAHWDVIERMLFGPAPHDLDRAIVVDRRIESPFGAQDPTKFYQPSIFVVPDVGEDRTREDQREEPVLEGKMGKSGSAMEMEGGGEVGRAPSDPPVPEIHAPDLCRAGVRSEEAGESAPSAAEVEYSVPRSQVKADVGEAPHHVAVFELSSFHVLFGSIAKPWIEADARGRKREPVTGDLHGRGPPVNHLFIPVVVGSKPSRDGNIRIEEPADLLRIEELAALLRRMGVYRRRSATNAVPHDSSQFPDYVHVSFQSIVLPSE